MTQLFSDQLSSDLLRLYFYITVNCSWLYLVYVYIYYDMIPNFFFIKMRYNQE
jgi:hypothetical protein